MKKLFLPLVIIAFIITGFKSDNKPVVTILGDGTPYYIFPEKMLGKVKTVIEKSYWAVPEGKSFKKGTPLTSKDRDNLGGWTDDIEVTYNNKGELVSCNNIDEHGKSIRIYKVFKEKDGSVRGENFINDALNYYDTYKLDKQGNRIGFVRYKPKADTMIFTFDIKTNPSGDIFEYHSVNSKGESLYKLLVLFDKSGQFSRSEGYNKEGVFQFSNEVKYNDKGKVSEITGYDKDKKATISATYTYEYDSKGNSIKIIGKTDKNLVLITLRAYTYF
jgi:hypothetical protein